MDHSVLRHSNRTDLAAYLRQAAARSSTKAVTDELLSAVLIGSIAPKIFHVWLSASHDANVVHDAVYQTHSRTIRTAGIRHFGRLFCSSRLQEAWKAIGGTPGILDVLSRASVYDVKKFCSEIGKGGTILVESTLRQRYADELFKALCYQNFPETEYKTADMRALFTHYQDVLPACSPELVVRHVENEIKSLGPTKTLRLLQAHSSVFRDKYLSMMTGQSQEWTAMSISAEIFEGLPTDTPAEQNPRISTSMLFAIRLLQRFTQEEVIVNKIDPTSFQDKVVNPLLRKLARRRCKPDVLEEVVRMIVVYVNRYMPNGLDNGYEMTKDGAIWHIVSRWVRHPDRLEKSLVDFLGLYTTLHRQSFEGHQVSSLIESVPLPMRWPLLVLLMKHHKWIQVDLSSDDDLRELKARFPATLLLALPSNHARHLLERLIRLKPDGDFIYSGTSRTTSKYQASYDFLPLQHNGDPTCLLILLSRTHPDCLEKARLAIEERRKEATRSRDPKDRASWVRNALDCAVASGSIDVYRKTLIWARRFNKDQNTVKEIYSSESIHTVEALDLLCGVPEDCDISNVTIEDVRSNVLLANEICRDLFNTARMAQKEPSFHQRHWAPVMSLFEEVTRLRFRRVNHLQDVLSLSDEEVFDTVWKDTLETCLTLEQIGLEEEQSRLGFRNAGGPLQRYYDKSVDLDQPRTPALQFIDALARRRNDLWEKYRARNNPSTLTLPPPYPRGLPVQHMLPFEVKNWREGFDLPYLKKRAEAIVFVDSTAALSLMPAEKELRVASGMMVDDYRLALKLYVCAYPIREQQALAAWKHATGPLSQSRMSPAEAFVFWQKVFKNALGGQISGPWSHPYLAKLPDPELPPTENASGNEPIEWNPDPEATAYDIKTRSLEVTILDQMLSYSFTPYDNIESNSCNIVTSVSGSAARPLWERFSLPKTSPRTQEALIVAALLHLNGKRCGSHRLLVTPFPSDKAVRFPALILDDEFLDRKDLDETGPLIEFLQGLDEAIPPTLLLQLVKAMFTELEANEDNAKLAYDAFALLKLLSKGDRPELALDLIVDVILNRPHDSTWHRSLTTLTLFEHLPAQTAKQFMESMARSMQMRLHGRPSRSSDAENTAKLPRLPAVKITTVKMLAQLTSGAEFITEATVVSILERLMVHAPHLDIRVAVVQSMLHTFTESSDRAVKDRILDVLEEHAVPIAGSLNEEVRMTEDDWVQAEINTESIPEIYIGPTDQDLGPILSALVETARHHKRSVEDRNDLVSRLLLPSLELSTQVNQRWMALYLRKLGVLELDLPKVPVKLRLLSSMFDHPSHLPAWALKLWVQVFAVDLNPPPAIAQVTTRITEDVALRDSNAGQHWLSLWKQRNPIVYKNRALLIKLLAREWQTAIADGIDHTQLQDLILQQADGLIRTSDEKFSDLKPFLEHLLHPVQSMEANPVLRAHRKSVIGRLIHHIDTLRTPSWQNDPQRSPALLPDTFEMHVWLLTYRASPNAPPELDRQTFTAKVSQIIDDLANSTTMMYWYRYEILESSLLRNYPLEYSDFLSSALTLGDVSFLQTRPCQIADLLRVRFAAAVFRRDHSQLIPAKSEILALLQTWHNCEVEEIRNMGFAVRTLLNDQGEEW